MAGAGAPASRGDLQWRGIRERVMEDIQRPLVLAHLDLEARAGAPVRHRHEYAVARSRQRSATSIRSLDRRSSS